MRLVAVFLRSYVLSDLGISLSYAIKSFERGVWPGLESH